VAHYEKKSGEMAIYLRAASAYMLGVDASTMPNPSETRQIRLKRLKFRSWHRGTQEMDLLLGRFADAQLETLSDRELDLYEAVLNQADQDLYAWITGERPWPTSLNNPLTGRLTSMTASAPRGGPAAR
jgi:antitoxin CptB